MAEPADGVPVVTSDGRAYVRTSSGGLASVPQDQLDDFISSGQGTLASAEDVAARKREKQYDGQAGRTFLEGTGRGLTLGLSDVAQVEGAGIGTRLGNYLADAAGLGPTEQATGAGLDAGTEAIDREAEAEAARQQAKADIAGRKEANSGAATGGELLGGIGLSLMTGGLGTAGLAGRGATVLGKAGYMGLAGAMEGAAYGAAQAADQDFLSDHEITAERILLGAGEGLVLGGALGMGGSLIGSGAQRMAARTREAMSSLGKRLGIGTKAAEGGADTLETVLAMESDDALRAAGEAEAGAGVRVKTEDALGSESASQADTAVSMKTEDQLRVATDTQSDAAVSFELSAAPDPVAQQEARGALRASGLKDDGRSIFQQARAAEGGFEKAQQQAVTDISSDLKAFIKSSDVVDENAGIAAKRRASEMFNMPGMKIGMQEVGPVIGQARAAMADLLSNEVRREAMKSGGGYTVISRVTDMLDATEREVARAFERGAVGDGYMMLDQGLKKAMQQASKSRNPLVAEIFKNESDKVRLFLEDESIWGDLARRQKFANPAWTEAIRREGDADVGGFFKRSGEASVDPFEVLDKPNEYAIGGLLNELGSAESAGREEAFRRYLRAKVIDAETRAQAWGTPELRKSAAQMRAAADKIERRMNEVALMRRDAVKWADIKKTTESVPFLNTVLKGAVNLTQKAATVAESAAAREVATSATARGASAAESYAARDVAADAAAQGMSLAEVNAARKASVMAEARRAAAQGEMQVESRAGELLRSVMRGAAVKAEKAVQAASKAATVVPIAGVILNPRDPASYEKAIKRLLILQDAASDDRRQLLEQNDQLAMDAPDHMAAITAQTQRTADFLVDKAGVSGVDLSSPFGHLRKVKHDPAKAESLARYARAAQNPGAALKRISNGDATREDIETMKALYPRLWARFGAKVRARLAELKEVPDYGSQLRLSKLLDQPMTPFESPTFQAAIVATNGATERAEQQAQQQRQGLTKLSNAVGNGVAGSDQTLLRGE